MCGETDWSMTIHMSTMLDDPSHGFLAGVSLPPSSRAPRVSLAPKTPFPKAPFPFPSNACHAGYSRQRTPPSSRQFKPTRAGRVKLFNRQRTIGAFLLLRTATGVSLLTLHSGVTEVKQHLIFLRNPVNRKIATTIWIHISEIVCLRCKQLMYNLILNSV